MRKVVKLFIRLEAIKSKGSGKLLSILKKIFVGSNLRRFILVIILSVVTGILSYNFYQNNEFQNLRNKNKIVEDKLKDMIKEYKGYFDLRIKCFGIEGESKREDSFFKADYEFYQKNDNKNHKMLFRFVTINNTNEEVFWEDWPYKDILKYEPKEVNINKSNVESYINKNSYTYIKYGQNYANGYISILPKNPGEKKVDITNWTTYYWLDKRDYSSDDIIKSIELNIDNARKMAVLICALGIVTLIYLISLLAYIIRVGIKGILRDIKASIIRIGINFMKLSFWNPCKKLLKTIKKVFIGNFLRQFILIIIFSVIGIMVICNFLGNANYKNLQTRSEKELRHADLMSKVPEVDKEIIKYTDGFNDIANNEITPEAFEKHRFNAGVRFAIVNNYNKKIYWDPWSIIDINNYGTSISNLKNFENYIKNNSYVYVRFGADDYPTIRYKNNSNVMSVSIFYWEDYKNQFNDEDWKLYYLKNKVAWKQVVFIAFWITILLIFIISKVIYIRKFGIKKFLSDIKSECIELKRKFDFVCEKLSFEGPYKKTVIIFLITLIFYITISCIEDGAKDPAYFIKKIIFLEKPIVFVFILFIFMVFLLSLKKIKNFKYTLEYTENIVSGDLTLEIKKSGDIDMDKLAISINSIRNGYEMAFKEAVKNERVKTELIANVSHDLKTPLTSILTYVDLLKRDNLSLEEKEDYMKIVEKKTKKLNTLIEDLVEVSEVNSGKIKLNKEKVDMVSLIYQVIGECSNYHDERNIKFKVKSFSEKVELYIDGKRMSRLIGNVISNAIKYSMPDTNVYVEVEKENDDIVVSFKSISENEMKFDVNEIFDRFKRGDESRNSKVEGSGLGLAIAKGIAELHGGRMYAEKEGDLFKMFLVLKESLEAD